MNKIWLTIFLCLFFIIGLLKGNSIFGASENASSGYIVKAYIIVPSDRGKPPNVLEKYKSNALKGLEDAKRFYASKLQGHTFSYSPEVEIINANKGISSLNLRKISCPDEVVGGLGISLPQNGVLNVVFVMGVDLGVACGSGNLTGGSAWFSEDTVSKLGGSNKRALGLLMHEMGHAFGLINAGWSSGHPCSIESQQECKRGPQGLGTTIPYPSASQARYSIVGSGADYLDGPEAANVGFNNTESSPEIAEFYRSPFINPSGDPAPAPTLQSGGSKPSGEITDITPYKLKAGDTVKIIGNGFGDGKDGWLDFYTYPRPKFQTKSWTNSQIEFLINFIEQDEPTEFKFSVRKGKDQIYTPQTLTISPGKKKIIIDAVSPSSIEVGKELVISGGNLQLGGVIRITSSGSEVPIISNFKINSRKDNEIRISILEGPSKPTIYNVDIINVNFPLEELLVSIPIEVRPAGSKPNSIIFNIEPSQVSSGESFNIVGMGFGINPGILEFNRPMNILHEAMNLSYKWSDTNIQVTINESSYKDVAVFDVFILTASGNRVSSPVKLTLKPKTPQQPPNLGKITQISTDTVAVRDEIIITGNGFGDNIGLIQFADAVSGSSFVQKYEVRSWRGSEIRLVFLEELKRFPAIISVVTTSGEKILSPVAIHPKTSTPSPTPQASLVFSSNPITVGQDLTISGYQFGNNLGGLGFNNSVDSSLNDVGINIKSWNNSEIKLNIARSSYNFPTSWRIRIFKTGGDIDSSNVLTILPSPAPTAIPSPIASPTSIGFQTASTPPIPSPNSSTPPSISPSPSGEIPCGNGGVCINGNCIVGDAIDPNGFCPTTQTSTPTPTPTGSPTTSPTASPIVQKKKEMVTITTTNVEKGETQTITSNFNQALNFKLSPDSKSQAHILIIIGYNDGTSKSLSFTFNYKSTDDAVCNAKGGVCQTACTGTYSAQVGTCPSKNQLCCATPVTPSPNASKCTGTGPVAKGLGGPCSPNDKDIVSSAEGGTACTVASCYFNPDINEYCWYNSGTTYGGNDNYESCKAKGITISTPAPSNSSILKAEGLGTCYTNPSYDSNICPSIFRADKGGAGGQCGPENAGKSVDVLCQITCPNGNIAYGNTVSTCRQDGCYHNDTCSCDAVCTTGNQF